MWFDQKLDHFDESNDETWKQRYFSNDEYSKNNGINFLNIGGEGEESGRRISYATYPMVQWGKALGAKLWNLEHRFYGASRPKP